MQVILLFLSLFTICSGLNIFQSFLSFFFGSGTSRFKNNQESQNNAAQLCAEYPYRTMDGSYNNLKNPLWGSQNTPYIRLLPNTYADGIYSLPTSRSGYPLMSARKISVELFKNKPVEDNRWTLTTMQYGQLVAHDMSFASGPQPSPQCCVNGKDVGTNPSCANIPVPPNDEVHPNEECLNFDRTMTTKDNNCSAYNVPADPITAVTAFMDASFLYGSTDSKAKSLRTMQCGKMKTVTRNGQEWPPQVPEPTQTCNVKTNQDICYSTGDDRANQNTELTMLQVMYLRKHNKIADCLCSMNKNWNDEKIYQETRRIICAYFQHVTYYEVLPLYLGRSNMLKKKLIYKNPVGYINDYDPNTNPGITVEHATVAFRFIHSAIAGSLKMSNEARETVGAVRLSTWMNKPSILEEGSNFKNFARGINTQPQMQSDCFFDEETTNYLFRGDNENGTDLRALDIQRARDHGVPTYNDMREYCGLPRAKRFSDFYDTIPIEKVDQLSKIYNTPDEVELSVGGALERVVDGSQVGPTFLCILLEQFYRTRKCDRYFYEMGDQAGAFTLGQLSAIRKGATIASIYCEVGGIKSIQRQALNLVSPINPVVSCDKIPTIDLSYWIEK